ncbi:MAG: hypothetical protein M3464_13545 [Chloroflexota bacterium]|nr:hypothetical protein [Chloroflexota bacterium]
MATLTESRPEHVEPIDPNQDPVFQTFSFSKPTINAIDWDKAVLSYDRVSDILLVFVADRYQPAVVVYGDDDQSVSASLVNPETMQFVGWQFESFLMSVVKQHPDFIDVLDHAELVGLTANEFRGERQRVLGHLGRVRSWLTREIARLRHGRSNHQAHVLRSLVERNSSRVAHGPSFGPAA